MLPFIDLKGDVPKDLVGNKGFGEIADRQQRRWGHNSRSFPRRISRRSLLGVKRKNPLAKEAGRRKVYQ